MLYFLEHLLNTSVLALRDQRFQASLSRATSASRRLPSGTIESSRAFRAASFAKTQGEFVHAPLVDHTIDEELHQRFVPFEPVG